MVKGYRLSEESLLVEVDTEFLEPAGHCDVVRQMVKCPYGVFDIVGMVVIVHIRISNRMLSDNFKRAVFGNWNFRGSFFYGVILALRTD